MTTYRPRTPKGLQAAGRRLWIDMVEKYTLTPHGLSVLEEACRIKDRIVQIDKAVADEGLMLSSSQGARLHPGIAESRQQRQALARVLTSLG